MINTILVEDDLYIQKHFVDRLAADGEFHLVGVFRDAFEAEKHCDATVKLVLMDVQTQHKHSGLAAAKRIKKAFPQIKIVVATSLVDPEVLQSVDCAKYAFHRRSFQYCGEALTGRCPPLSVLWVFYRCWLW